MGEWKSLRFTAGIYIGWRIMHCISGYDGHEAEERYGILSDTFPIP